MSKDNGKTGPVETRPLKSGRPKVGLFVTCLVDLYRPVVGFASFKLLEQAGCDVDIPLDQTCCGQPAYNSGDRESAQALALNVIEQFERFDYVVAPSGSCSGMLKAHYPELFSNRPQEQARAQELAAKTFELTSFLVDICGCFETGLSGGQSVTYHDSCAGLRELGVKNQPRQLLKSLADLELREMEDSEACCGFGGTFCVKYPEISTAMVGRKEQAVMKTKADMLLGGDMGCLMNMAGKLSREGSSVKVRHVAEVLADMCDEAPIAGKKD